MSNTTPPTKQNNIWKTILSLVSQWLIKNWQFKLIAVFVSVVLWATLISQDPTLTREKTFNDITVSVVGEDVLKRNGFIVTTNLQELLSGVSIKANVPQVQYQTASYQSYNPRIDLAKINNTGVQSVKITTTNSSTYGTVVETNPDTIELTVDEYVTRYRIPVSVITEGTVPAGFYATNPSIDPPRVTISGPKSMVEKIVRAEAILDLSALPTREGTIRTAVPLVLIASDGSAVENNLIEVTGESVLIDSAVAEQTLYPTKQVAIGEDALLTGKPADGYEVKSVTVSPTTVTIAAKGDVLESITQLRPDTQINLKDRSESFTEQLKLSKPSDVNYISADSVTVSVVIEPKKTFKTFLNVKIDIVNVSNGTKAVPSSRTATVVITGPKHLLDSMKSNNIVLYCDAAGLTQGEYRKLPVQWYSEHLDESCHVDLSPATIDLSVKQ